MALETITEVVNIKYRPSNLTMYVDEETRHYNVEGETSTLLGSSILRTTFHLEERPQALAHTSVLVRNMASSVWSDDLYNEFINPSTEAPTEE